MEIANSYTYTSSIYSAIVVNSDYMQDPEGLGRVQIFIPSKQYEYADDYYNYMLSDNKQENELWTAFPWAVTTITELKNGDTIIGSFIDNQNDRYVILGKDIYNAENQGALGTFSATSSQILNLTMPIILHNEVGLSINAWADNIPDSAYTRINPKDNGGWSIGLIQWHHCRAFDCLFEIAKADGEWERHFSNKNLQLVLDLKSSIKSGSAASYRTKYQSSFQPTKGSDQYNGIQGMLGSEIGKKVQRDYAAADTASSIDTMMNTYNITNPAIIIFMADVMNQYGPYLPTTLQRAGSISSGSGDIMGELDSLINYMKTSGSWSSYNTYINRRNTTYAYIKGLYSDGTLNETTILTDLAGDTENKIEGAGTYCMPFEGRAQVTALWGPLGYLNYHNGSRYHTGVDFALNSGTKLYACTSGTISVNSESLSTGYGYSLKLMADDGRMILYAHCNKFLKRSGRVLKGDLIALSGDTGNSSGPHLHFEIRHSPYRYGKGNGDDENPLVYLGIGGAKRNQYVGGN